MAEWTNRCIEAYSQGVVGEGSTTEEPLQGPERRLDGWGSHHAKSKQIYSGFQAMSTTGWAQQEAQQEGQV